MISKSTKNSRRKNKNIIKLKESVRLHPLDSAKGYFLVSSKIVVNGLYRRSEAYHSEQRGADKALLTIRRICSGSNNPEHFPSIT